MENGSGGGTGSGNGNGNGGGAMDIAAANCGGGGSGGMMLPVSDSNVSTTNQWFDAPEDINVSFIYRVIQSISLWYSMMTMFIDISSTANGCCGGPGKISGGAIYIREEKTFLPWNHSGCEKMAREGIKQDQRQREREKERGREIEMRERE